MQTERVEESLLTPSYCRFIGGQVQLVYLRHELVHFKRLPKNPKCYVSCDPSEFTAVSGPAHQLPMLSSLSATVSSNLGPIFWFILAKVIYVDTHNQTEISMAEGASCSPSQRKVFLELELLNYFVWRVEGSLSHVNDLNLTSISCMTNYIIVDKNILKNGLNVSSLLVTVSSALEIDGQVPTWR